jgi:RecJ-like exonuclease
MPQQKTCEVCKGKGYVGIVNCDTCSGLGFVDIDAGVEAMKEKQKQEEKVNHPKHYTFGTIEVIEVIEDWELGFHEGNCIKYIARAKHKGEELQDLKKAQWYLNKKIKNMELWIAAGDDK